MHCLRPLDRSGVDPPRGVAAGVGECLGEGAVGVAKLVLRPRGEREAMLRELLDQGLERGVEHYLAERAAKLAGNGTYHHMAGMAHLSSVGHRPKANDLVCRIAAAHL